MKMTRAIAKAIRAQCIEVCGGTRLVEIGERCWLGMPDTRNIGFNFLLEGSDSDLFDNTRLSNTVGLDIPTDHGWVALDCYCYTTGHDGELDCNVYILLNPTGDIRYASANDLRHAEEIDAVLKAEGDFGYSPA